MAKQLTPTYPKILRVTTNSPRLATLVADGIVAGLPLVLPPDAIPEMSTKMSTGTSHDTDLVEWEDGSAIDPSLSVDAASVPTPPQTGTSYAGLSPAQRHAFITWSRKPELPAPAAYQQLFLANVEARLFEPDYRQLALETLHDLRHVPMWSNNPAYHRAMFLACWLTQDGALLASLISTGLVSVNLLGGAFGLQALLNVTMTPTELGVAIAAWQLGERLPSDLLKLRLDSLTAILGQPPLAHALEQLPENATLPRPWRAAHRGLRLHIPQPDLRAILEPSLFDALAVADVDEADAMPIGTLDALNTTEAASAATSAATSSAEDAAQPGIDEIGWRLILEFGSNRSEYFDYVLIQAQKLAGYSQIMDEDRRIVYRIIFRKSEMRRFWRIWDYVHGWASTRVYLHGVELEKWKVWPSSQYLR